jgi:hypothetical protein
MLCCQLGYSIKRRILSLFYSKEPVLTQNVNFIRNNSTVPELTWITIIPENSMILTTVQSVSVDHSKKRYRIWQSGECYITLSNQDIRNILEDKPEKPWLWVGAILEGASIDMTNELEELVVRGNKITPWVLSVLYPNHSSWKYLDPVTFKEVEFPVDGITIHDPRMENDTEIYPETPDSD